MEQPQFDQCLPCKQVLLSLTYPHFLSLFKVFSTSLSTLFLRLHPFLYFHLSLLSLFLSGGIDSPSEAPAFIQATLRLSCHAHTQTCSSLSWMRERQTDGACGYAAMQREECRDRQGVSATLKCLSLGWHVRGNTRHIQWLKHGLISTFCCFDKSQQETPKSPSLILWFWCTLCSSDVQCVWMWRV